MTESLLLGNNGAGKSTLFKIISGQLIANSGSVSTKLDFQTEIGMMPQGDILIDDLTVLDLVILKTQMNKLNNVDYDALLAMVDLGEHRNQYVRWLIRWSKKKAFSFTNNLKFT